MGGSQREPTDADGPLYRAAYQRAREIDDAATPAQRRKAWARLAPVGLGALAETVLRDVLIWGAVLFSIIVAALGVTSGALGWAVGCLASGVAGIAVTVVAVRRWSVGRQWSVYLGVVLLQSALMVALWQGQ